MNKVEDALARAAEAARTGDMDGAIEQCRRALKRDKRNVRALFIAGNCAMQAGRHQDAAKWLQRAATLETGAPEIFNNLGAALLNCEQPEAAAEALRRALALKPDYANARVNLANALRAAGEFAEAAEELQNVLDAGGPDPKLLAELGDAHARAGDPAAAAKAFAAALEGDPENGEIRLRLVRELARDGKADEAMETARGDPAEGGERARRLTDYGEALHDARQSDRAAELFGQALAAAPRHFPAWSLLDTIYRQAAPRWHFNMLNDTDRNEAYDTAIRTLIRPGDVVLDIGAGSGLLAMMAVRAGAAHVYSCERVGLLAKKAREIVAANGFADKITIIDKWSTDLVVGTDLPARADVVISEIVDNVLIGEGVVPSLKHAFEELAAPEARVIPRRGSVYVMPVECDMAANLGHVDKAAGFDVSAFNGFGAYGFISTKTKPEDFKALAEQQTAFSFDLGHKVVETVAEERTLRFEANTGGVLHGAVVWMDLELDDEITLSSTPGGEWSHWLPAYYLTERPRRVEAGEEITVIAGHDTANMHVLVE